MADFVLCLKWYHPHWIFWLRPDNVSFDQNTHRPFMLACSDLQGEKLLTIVPDIVAGLRRIEERSGEDIPEKALLQRSDFERVFHNDSLLREKGSNNLFGAFVRFDPGEDAPESFPWARLALFKALYLYLEQDERYRFMDASIAFVYCAWQRYNLIKVLRSSQPSEAGANPIDSEFTSAYRALMELLARDAFSYAFYVLWRSGWRDGGNAEDLAEPLIRERFELSLILAPDSVPLPNPKAYEVPHDAPLCFRKNMDWRQVCLYEPFSTQWRPTVRRLIRDRLLPRYNLLAAVRLAYRSSGGVNFMGQFVGVLLPTFCMTFTLVVLGYHYWRESSLWNDYFCWQGLNSDYFTIFIPLIPLFFALMRLEWKSLPNLILPRLWGGIILGYLALVLHHHPWHVIESFVKPDEGPLWILGLGTTLVGLSALYLAYEAYSAIDDLRRAFGRSLIVLVWALLASFAIGIWFCRIGAPVYQHAHLSLTPELFANTHHPVSIPALLTLAPIALFIGIIVESIWEEKPVTATIWPTPEH